MIALWIVAASCVLALIPALLFWWNLRLYLPPPAASLVEHVTRPAVSVLIPARNEERSIGAAVRSVLASRDVEVEVIVLDDHSTDRTAVVVQDIAAGDPRVRLAPAPALPEGWCGKQHACAVLAELALHPLLVFADADMRLAPDGLACLAAFLQRSGADLVSGVPRQETGSLVEQLVLPLIHVVLLGFLPLWWMRRSAHPAFGAGCGQLFVARRSAYERVGGHAAIRASLHDGVALPRAFRAAGLQTDLCDATPIAACRMYRGARDVWRGLTKNAHEGLATPMLIGPSTLLLFGGQVLPPLALLVCLTGHASWLLVRLAVIGTIAAYYPRLAGARRFRQPLIGALLHPVGVLILLVIQWWAFARSLARRPVTWKDRAYALAT